MQEKEAIMEIPQAQKLGPNTGLDLVRAIETATRNSCFYCHDL